MVRKTQRLSVKSVAAKRRPGYYADGDGLYLQVSTSGSKSWVFRFMIQGKTVSSSGKPLSREMGLGPFPDISLHDARTKAGLNRGLLRDGIDPIEARNSAKALEAAETAKAKTFSECSAAFLKAHRAGWKNEKHAEQWTNTLATYCDPVFGPLPVQSVDTGLMLKVLEPIWSEKAETATRLRARIERVLDWATVRGHRTGENPARWRGHLDKLLPKLKKKLRVKHHPALPFEEMGPFMVELRALDGVAPRALEFTILTCARTNEVIGARPKEFDLDKALWTVPAGRMKGQVEHRVPLSPRAVAIVREMLKSQSGSYVFPGQRDGKPLSNMALLHVLQNSLGREDLTVHGFRSSFRDWAAERTSYAREVVEMALAHVISDATEAAYRRGDLFDKRRRLMEEWARYCAQAKRESAKVTSIKKAAA